MRLYSVVTLSSTKHYRYVRYVGPENGYCNVSEVAFMRIRRTLVLCRVRLSVLLMGKMEMENMIIGMFTMAILILLSIIISRQADGQGSI